MDGTLNDRERLIMSVAASHFGKDVVGLDVLKQSPFSSLRVHFSDETVIATQRRNFRRTNLEGLILQQIAPVCDDVPAFLGMSDGILFQSDIGGTRLGDEVRAHEVADQLDLAAEACASIFRYQSAARQTGLLSLLPKLGTSQDWMEDIVGSVDALQLFSVGIPDGFDYQALADLLTVSHWEFVKWHCRPNYAIICDDGFLRWNSFELSGLRHGAEDLAWLIGDETWPIEPEDMLDVVRDGFAAVSSGSLDRFLEYLSVYTTLHCAQRFKHMTHVAQDFGWYGQDVHARKEDPEIHPESARRLCYVGAYFADRSELTRALVPHFEQTGRALAAIAGSDLS